MRLSLNSIGNKTFSAENKNIHVSQRSAQILSLIFSLHKQGKNIRLSPLPPSKQVRNHQLNLYQIHKLTKSINMSTFTWITPIVKIIKFGVIERVGECVFYILQNKLKIDVLSIYFLTYVFIDDLINPKSYQKHVVKIQSKQNLKIV